MARFANHKGFKQMTVFLTWFPGSLDPTWLDLQFLMVLKQMAVFLTWIPGSLDPLRLDLQTLMVFNGCLFDLDPWIPGSN